jgi:hypothetical protein
MITSSPSSVAFDQAMAYSTSPSVLTSIDSARGVYGYQPQTLTLQNTGGSSITITSVTASSGFIADTGCNIAIAAGAKCNLRVAFVPTDVGSASGTITVNYAGGPTTIPVTGAGTLTVTNASIPSSIPSFYQATNGLWWAFPVQTTAPTPSTTFTIANRGTSTVTGLAVALNEGNSADVLGLTNFAALSTTCGTSLTAGASCTATVTYAPAAVGAHRAVLKIATSNASTLYPEIYGESVSSVLSRTESNPYCPTTGSPSYPGSVTVDGPATLPTDCVNTTDANINYSGNTISGVTVYEVCPTGQNTGGTNCAYATNRAAIQQIATDARCGFWIKTHAQNVDGSQAVYNESISDLDWPTAFNPVKTYPSAPATCTSNNYWTTDKLSSLPPPGNRISPAWEGYSMLPGYPPFAQPPGGPGNFVPLIYGSSINTDTLRIPQGIGLKMRIAGIHFSGDNVTTQGNTPVITPSYFNAVNTSYPDCSGSPPATGICVQNDSLWFDRVLISTTQNWISICATCVRGAGIVLSGTSHAALINSYIADIHCNAGGICGTDSKAVGIGGSGYVSTRGVKLDNDFLSAGGVPLEDGGSRTTNTPSDMIATNIVLYKPWFYFSANTFGQYGQPPRLFNNMTTTEISPIKNSLELKNFNRVLFENLISLHSSAVQADQFGEAIHFNNLNNQNDGQECGGATACTGYASATPTRSPSFFGVSVSNITLRNFLIANMNKCFLIGNEYNDSGTYQIPPVIGDLKNFSIHDGLCDEMDGVKYGPHGGGGEGALVMITVAPLYTDPATFGNYCSGAQCTWNSWSPTVIQGLNDRSTHPENPANVTIQRVTGITNTMNTSVPPVGQTVGDLIAAISSTDHSSGAVILDATATQSGSTCNATIHFVGAAPFNETVGATIYGFTTPDISSNTSLNWSTVHFVVDTIITGPPAGITGHTTATCPSTTINQTNYPLPVFPGLVLIKTGPAIKYPNMMVLDSVFWGDYQGESSAPNASQNYDANWNNTSGAGGYCWTGNFMVPNAGPNHITLAAPTNFPNCGSFPLRNNIVGSGAGTYNDAALGFLHYVDGSFTKLIFGGTNDYTVSSTAATYSTTNGPVGVSPSALTTALNGVLDGVH